MTQKIKKLIRSRNNGFLIVEAIYSVMVTLLIVVTLQGLIKTITVSNHLQHHTDDIVFSYVQFNQFLADEDVKTVFAFPEASNSRQAAVEKVTKDGESNIYLLTHYKNMIRVTTPEGGHMPLLLNIKRAFFVTMNRQIKITITEEDGRKSEIYFKLDPIPKKKEKNANKKIHQV